MRAVGRGSWRLHLPVCRLREHPPGARMRPLRGQRLPLALGRKKEMAAQTVIAAAVRMKRGEWLQLMREGMKRKQWF